MALLFRSAAALLEAGQSVALESNFDAELDTPPLRQLADRFRCRFVQVVCTASGPTLVERYRRRIATGERHPGHTDAASLGEILSRLLTERWDALDLDGAVIRVDTEREVGSDLDALAQRIRLGAQPAHVFDRAVSGQDPERLVGPLTQPDCGGAGRVRTCDAHSE